MQIRDRIMLGTGLATMAAAVLAIGGASRWSVIGIAALAAAAAASQVNSRRRLAGVSPLLVLLGGAVVLTVLQLVPVPPALARALDGPGHELVADGQALLDPGTLAAADAAQLLGHRLAWPDTAWRPVSLDPAGTLVELVKLCGLFLLAWMALRAAASERGRYRLLAGVAGVAGLVALIGVAHELVGAERLFGFYAPEHANPIVLAPLLNPNHLACLMALGALIAGGLALHEHRSPPLRALWILVTLLCVGVGIATRSRGGVMALGAGTTVMAVVMVLQRLRAGAESRRRDVVRVAMPAAIIVLCSLVLVVYLGGSEVRTELESTDLQELSDPRSKYAAWGSALTLVEDAPVLGVGRGAFQSAFTRVHAGASQVTFSHVENEYLQVVVDWGVVGAIGLTGALGFVIIVVIRRWRNGALTAAAIGGLAAVGVHSLVDFGLEMPGIAIPTLLVAATLLHVPLEEASRSRERTALRAAAIAVTVLVAVVAATPRGRTLAEDHAAFSDAEPTLAEARAAFARHPLDYVSAAYLSRTAKDPRERAAFLNLAMRLHPRHPGLHRAVASSLAATGRLSQAAIEYRLALLGSADPDPLVAEVVKTFPTAAAAADALPVGHRMWARISKSLVETGHNDVALRYLTALVDSGAQTGPDVWSRLFQLADKQGDVAVAQRAAIELAKVEGTINATVELARMYLRLGRYDEARTALAGVATEEITSPEHVEARFLLCQVHMATLDWQASRTCLNGILLGPSVTMVMRRRIHARLATVEDALGNKERAQFERKLAAGEPASGIDGSGSLR